MSTKADRYMSETICTILEEGYHDINPRPKYSDGTPAHTISINHTFRKYDLSKNEFPICTLRPIAWKTGIKEIFTIYQKPTNEVVDDAQISLESVGIDEIYNELKTIDVDTLTPIESMKILYDLSKKAKSL